MEMLVRLLVRPPLWSRLKYLMFITGWIAIKFGADVHNAQKIKSWWSSDFSCHQQVKAFTYSLKWLDVQATWWLAQKRVFSLSYGLLFKQNELFEYVILDYREIVMAFVIDLIDKMTSPLIKKINGQLIDDEHNNYLQL